jgi:hypothetical protein
MTPDPKWLEILKASGWQTTALAAAFGAILLVMRLGWIVTPDLWFTAFCALAFLICLFLALASIGHAITDFLQPRVWLAKWAKEKQQRKVVREYIPYMTKQEKGIVAYMLAKNQKMITAEQDGGYAATLISRGILVRAMRPGQVADMMNVPFIMPDHVWDELELKRDSFPYRPAKRQDGVEPHPWRVPWMAR